MQIADAKEAVDQILNEECVRPTIMYRDAAISRLIDGMKQYANMTGEQRTAWAKIAGTPRNSLYLQRKESPRFVTETPHVYQLSATNFDLLISAYGQVSESDRPDFIAYILRYVEAGGTRFCRQPDDYKFPAFAGKVCDLPLIAEFCIRTGNIERFFASTAKPKRPTDPLAIMMIQLEETIALNWDLFSNEQLQEIPRWLAPLRETAYHQTHSATRPRGGPMVKNPHYVTGREAEANRIVRSIDDITRECTQARYWYLKGALQRTVNLEVESDKATVEDFLTRIGFSGDMINTLNAAENEYRTATDSFELKNSLSHIRSFLEHLHREAANSIAGAMGETVPDRWGDATHFLQKHGYYTKQHEGFVTSLYTLISDTSIHPLGADREYARLLRNVVIEYGVMFLSVLADRGVKLN